MPRKAKKVALPGWASATPGGEDGRFIRLGVSFFEHSAVCSMTASEFQLYAYLVKIAGQSREFEIPRSEYSKFMGVGTFCRARDGLIQKGFIETIYCGKNTRENSRYRFCFEWKNK